MAVSENHKRKVRKIVGSQLNIANDNFASFEGRSCFFLRRKSKKAVLSARSNSNTIPGLADQRRDITCKYLLHTELIQRPDPIRTELR